MPRRVATMAAVFGIMTSGVQVATVTRSMSAADRPLAASALPPAATAMSATLSSGLASRLLSMPTRLRIHSSLVSTVPARVSLVSTFGGWYPPNARIREPWDPSVSRIGGAPFSGPHRVLRYPAPRPSCRLRLQPDQRLARGDRVAVLDQPLQDDRGEAGSHRLLAAPGLHMPQRRAGTDVGAGRAVLATGPEGARRRGDQQPPVRGVAGVVVVRRAVLGQQRARRRQVLRRLQGGPGQLRQGPPGKAGQRAARRELDERGGAEPGHRA